MITALGPVAMQLGANRVVAGRKIPHPVGDPGLAPDDELRLRVGIVRAALAAVGSSIDEPSLFAMAGEEG
jgi:glycine/betaine/sarcosine/D-proline reductase family selenoprotein B